MKKAIVFTIVLLMASTVTVKAQTTKGKFFVAGSNRLGLNIGGEKQKVDGNLVEGSESTYFDFNVQPRFGYAVINNLFIGLFMDVDIYSVKDKDDTYGYEERSTTVIAGPFARYYIPVSEKLVPFAEAQVGFGIDHFKNKNNSGGEWSKYNETVLTYRLGGGATYFFNDMIGADLFLGFLHDAYTHKDDESERSISDIKEKTIYNEFVMQLGIVVMLDK